MGGDARQLRADDSLDAGALERHLIQYWSQKHYFNIQIMKRKQPISAKSQFYKKKKELPSAVDDLATHEEKDIKQI